MRDARSASRPRVLPRAVIALLGAAILASATPPSALAHRLPLRVYTVADGLARDSVRCIVEDSRGFLWFCTDEGLSRFDGTEFRNYDEKDGLAGPSVRAALEEADGTYWVGTNAGLFRFDPRPRPGRPLFERVPLPTDPAPPAPGAPPPDSSTEVLATVLHRDPAGRLWVGSTRGAAWLERDASGSWQATPVAFVDEHDAPLRIVVRGFADDPDGGVLIGTRWWGVFRAAPSGAGAPAAAALLARRCITLEAMGGDLRALRRDRRVGPRVPVRRVRVPDTACCRAGSRTARGAEACRPPRSRHAAHQGANASRSRLAAQA